MCACGRETYSCEVYLWRFGLCINVVAIVITYLLATSFALPQSHFYQLGVLVLTVNVFAQLKPRMSGDTSQALIARMMDTECGHKHFTNWTLKEKQAAISACGLAHSKYKNTKACNEILHHLSTTRLPVCTQDVENALADRNINPARVKGSCKKLSLLLLQHMADGLSPPVPKKKGIGSCCRGYNRKVPSFIPANGKYQIFLFSSVSMLNFASHSSSK